MTFTDRELKYIKNLLTEELQTIEEIEKQNGVIKETTRDKKRINAILKKIEEEGVI